MAMAEPSETTSSAAPGGLLRSLLGSMRLAYLPVLVTYFCYGASGITSIALLYFQKDALGITPAEAAGIAFWVALPWSTKMVAGVASDVYPILGSRRVAYMLVGALLTFAGYAWLATTASSRVTYLAAMVLIAVGFMVQDVVADALSVEVARNDEEIKQVQTLGRMALLVGSISVGYLSGWLAGVLGPRPVFAIAVVLPVLVAVSTWFVPRLPVAPAPSDASNPLGAGKARLVVAVGLGYAALGVVLEALSVPFAQEIILVVSGALIVMLFNRVGISRSVAVAAFAIFCFRAVPGAGQGFSYWAIDHLGFDHEFLGVLAQVSAVLSLLGLIVFRKPITHRPVSYTLFWVTIVGSVLYLPTIGLFYGVNDWFGLSPRMFAFIDTTIAAPLGQLSMVPMLALIARTAPRGAEATMFAIMASLMNLALSASELFTRYLNSFFAVTQQDYSGLGRLLISVGVIGLLPLLALPLLRREEVEPPASEAVARVPAGSA
ncbi:MAG TPA: MFS transporter [Methylomirabilota bacterium]|jgi:MFS family permease|nr:MFS transporter [Methylomirabilota bacterium]